MSDEMYAVHSGVLLKALAAPSSTTAAERAFVAYFGERGGVAQKTDFEPFTAVAAPDGSQSYYNTSVILESLGALTGPELPIQTNDPEVVLAAVVAGVLDGSIIP